MYHYWISKKDSILNVYSLRDRGYETTRKKYLYKNISTRSVNRGIVLSENKVVDKMDIDEVFYCKDLTSKCRLLFNDQLTILEMDGKNMDLAFDIFFTLTESSENALFFIDDTTLLP